MRKPFVILFLLLSGIGVSAQELQGKLTVIANRVSNQVDRKIFQTMQTGLNNLIFTTKWTRDNFTARERIKCNFLLTITEGLDQNVYKATLTIQAARPVYNTGYESPLINFMDEAVTFRYQEFQRVEFNENRIGGNDALSGNLTAIMAYYVYVIIGLDYNSFSLRGGDPWFQKAMNIVNGAPEGRDISGWRAFDGQRNRYWLMENLTNSRYSQFHDAFYNFYRQGLDQFYSDENLGRAGIMESLNQFNNVNSDIPNTMFIQFFFQNRSNELIKLFGKASPDIKQKAVEVLQKLDPANSSSYKKELR